MNNHHDELFNPFFASIEIWQNYSIYWINKSKEIFNTATSATEDFGNTVKKSWINNAIYEDDKTKVENQEK